MEAVQSHPSAPTQRAKAKVDTKDETMIWSAWHLNTDAVFHLQALNLLKYDHRKPYNRTLAKKYFTSVQIIVAKPDLT